MRLTDVGIKTSILDTELTYRLRDWVNPIINSSHAKAMAKHCRDENSRHFIEGYSSPERYNGVLDIGVDPKFQRRGVARLLIEDGLKLVESQTLPVRLSATPARVPLYRSLIFRNIGQWTWRPRQELPWEIMQWNPCQVPQLTINIWIKSLAQLLNLALNNVFLTLKSELNRFIQTHLTE